MGRNIAAARREPLRDAAGEALPGKVPAPPLRPREDAHQEGDPRSPTRILDL